MFIIFYLVIIFVDNIITIVLVKLMNSNYSSSLARDIVGGNEYFGGISSRTRNIIIAVVIVLILMSVVLTVAWNVYDMQTESNKQSVVTPITPATPHLP